MFLVLEQTVGNQTNATAAKWKSAKNNIRNSGFSIILLIDLPNKTKENGSY